jgi:glycosyltransferase involved in cell wall biosynthesis
LRTEELISVVTPARNAERFIGRSLESVLGQTYSKIEIIVVDDGSTDATAAAVSAVAKTDPRVRLVQTDKIGVSAARNLAISNAKGSLIAPIDADDIWHPDKLAKQLAVLQAAPLNVGVVYCWSVGIDEDDRVVLPTWNNSTASGNVLCDIVVSGIAGNGSTPLIRREYVEAVGGYDEHLTLCEDWKFYTALAGICEFAVVPEYLTGYRLRADSASVNALPMEKAVAQVTDWIRRTWPWLPNDVLRDRDHTVDAYLAFLAIRERKFGHAFRFLVAALRAHPSKLVTLSYAQLYFLLLAHVVKLRCYRWAFWRRPRLAWSPTVPNGTPIAESRSNAGKPSAIGGVPK